MRRLLAFLFGCRHRRFSFPMTLSPKAPATVSCLACGQRFEYLWESMQVGAAVVR